MGETTITKELVAKMQETVQNLYLADEIILVVKIALLPCN